MAKNETLYKVLNPDGSTFNGGRVKWFLPQRGRPGKWMPALDADKLEACQYGYHLCRRDDLIQWLGPAIFMAECKGLRLEANDKIVVQQARLIKKLMTWNDRTARLFACDCAERALARLDNPDPRSLEAIRIARLFAEGKATREQLDATRDAAREAAWDAAREAAWDAARAARDAAWAAREAAREAARAAREAAWDAERKWQTKRLFEYLDGERSEAAGLESWRDYNG